MTDLIQLRPQSKSIRIPVPPTIPPVWRIPGLSAPVVEPFPPCRCLPQRRIKTRRPTTSGSTSNRLPRARRDVLSSTTPDLTRSLSHLFPPSHYTLPISYTLLRFRTSGTPPPSSPRGQVSPLLVLAQVYFRREDEDSRAYRTTPPVPRLFLGLFPFPSRLAPFPYPFDSGGREAQLTRPALDLSRSSSARLLIQEKTHSE